MARGVVFDIQRFSTHDGPGIRTTVFLKGCPLDCVWCHNPESKRFEPELLYTPMLCIGCGSCVERCPESAHAMVDGAHVFDRSRCRACLSCVTTCHAQALETTGREMTSGAMLAEVEKDRVFFQESGGGLTMSGGEPTAQIGFTLEVVSRAKAAGLTTCLETCGFGRPVDFLSLVPHVDLFLWDLKDTDEIRHLANTGVPLRPILENLRTVDRAGGVTILRCIMVPGVNVDDDHLRRIGAVRDELANCLGVELLEYHPLGAAKQERLGRPRSRAQRLHRPVFTTSYNP